MKKINHIICFQSHWALMIMDQPERLAKESSQVGLQDQPQRLDSQIGLKAHSKGLGLVKQP